MASYLVDGLVLPIAITGHPALDFCNTRAGWGAPLPKEYLHTHAQLALWAREHGLATAADVTRWHRAERRDPAGAAAVVARAVGLRSALYALLIGPATRTDWELVNAEIAAAAATATLAPAASPVPTTPAADEVGAAGPGADAAGAGAGLASWRLTGRGLDAPLLAVAWSVAELLTSATARS